MKKHIRLILVVLALLICFSIPVQAVVRHGISHSFTPLAAYNPTGDYAYDIVQYAKTQLGNGNTYLPNQAWCAAFVNHCARQVGVSTTDIPNTNSAYTLYTSGNGVRHTNISSYTPKKGDLIFFSDSGSLGDITHVGIVDSATSSYVYTIEGNYDNRVTRVQRPLSNSDNYIVAYLTPEYTGTQHSWTEYTLYKVCNLCGLKSYYSQRVIAPIGDN